MQTQRVNAYKNSVMTVFYIEQYNEELHEWFNIGGTYEKLEHASVSVENHNLKELAKELDLIK